MIVGRVLVRKECAGIVTAAIEPGLYNITESILDPGCYRLEYIGKSHLQETDPNRSCGLDISGVFMERGTSMVTTKEIPKVNAITRHGKLARFIAE